MDVNVAHQDYFSWNWNKLTLHLNYFGRIYQLHLKLQWLIYLFLKIEHEESQNTSDENGIKLKMKDNWIEARIDLKVAHEVLYN